MVRGFSRRNEGESRPPGRILVLYAPESTDRPPDRTPLHLADAILAADPTVRLLVLSDNPELGPDRQSRRLQYIRLPAGGSAERSDARAERIQSTLEYVRPLAFIVDGDPRGVAGELTEVLPWLRRELPATRTFVTLRDVIGEPTDVIASWDRDEVYGLLEECYDHILVYGVRSVFDTTTAYALPPAVASRVSFVGYFGAGAPQRTRTEIRLDLGTRNDLLVAVRTGGNDEEVGLASAFLRCMYRLPRDIHGVIVADGTLPSRELRRLRLLSTHPRVTLLTDGHDVVSVLAAADVVVTTASYEATCHILSGGIRGVAVARINAWKEEYLRARCLASRGYCSVLLPGELAPEILAERILTAADESGTFTVPFPLNGAERAAGVVVAALAEDRRQQQQHVPHLRLISG